jgi:hypothetical protein
LVRRETVNSIQAAMHLAALVFGRQVREQLDQAYKTASRLCMPPEQRTEKDQQDTTALGREVQALIDRMNREATLARQ